MARMYGVPPAAVRAIMTPTTEEWAIYTERNAPMHEPWTYSVCAGDNKIFIAAWGGGVIE